MSSKSYAQGCSIAVALDRIGDRWTLLIVRELLAGPSRFGDLLEQLPGLATNLLSARLKDLEAHGLVEQTTLPPPARVKVYRLTEIGLELAPTIHALARWGLNFLEDAAHASWPPNHSSIAVGMQSVFGSVCPDGLAGRIAFRFPGGEAGLVFGNGQVTAVRGPIENAQATIDTTPEAMMALAAEVLPLNIAAQRGLMKVDGSPETLMAFARLWEHALDNIPALRRRKQRLAAAKAAG